MSRLNPSQRTSVLASFRHLDNLLADSLRVLREADEEAPFVRHVSDAGPDQVRDIEDSIRRFRQTLLRVLESFGIDVPPPRTSALHAARVNLLYAEVALEELRPSRLRGYGEVAPEAAVELEEVVQELRELLRDMAEKLGRA